VSDYSPHGNRFQRRLRARVNQLRHVEGSIREGRQARQVASGDSIKNAPDELVYLLPDERGRMVQNQIYTVSRWSQKTETRIAPTVNRNRSHGLSSNTNREADVKRNWFHGNSSSNTDQK